MKKMLDMMEEKEGKASPEKLKAKMEVVKELRNMMSGMMKDKMLGDAEAMKKVTVAAKDEEGLKHGLEKAKDIVDQLPEMEEESAEEEASEEMSESSESEPKDMEAKIAEMEAMLAKMKEELKMKA